jgi:hypothetical protein
LIACVCERCEEGADQQKGREQKHGAQWMK